MTETAAELPDTDWRVPELYGFVSELEITTITANFSRYVVDLNRPADSAETYAGYLPTTVCPTRALSGAPIYRSGREPTASEVGQRIARYWRPYHDALAALVSSRARQYGYAVVYDAHSIAARVPALFPGELPALNLGTAHGGSCAKKLERAVSAIVSGSGLTHALNGRFVGGYITRRYGRPERCEHAMQMEISQAAYLDPRKRHVDAGLARTLRATLRKILRSLLEGPP